MLVTPFPVSILAQSEGEYREVTAEIDCLDDPTVARNEIDAKWWLDVDPEVRKNEADADWQWEDHIRQSLDCFLDERFCLWTAGRIEGAMVLHLDGLSLRTGEPLCQGMWLASSPLARQSLGIQKYKGVGEALVAFAAAKSYFVGYRGRLKILAVESAVGFYEGLGFEQISIEQNGNVNLELSEENARPLLTEIRNQIGR